tara:strand:- start:33 stop:254 length:222 start_codon:yes stop_codon:yes gene_type:complete
MIRFLLGYQPWKDVIVFKFAHHAGSGCYLLQATKHRLTKQTIFRVASADGLFGTVPCLFSAEDLKKANVWSNK